MPTGFHSVSCAAKRGLRLSCLGLLLVLVSGEGLAGSWTGTLQDGSVVEVDPGSRRAMRYYNGGTTPMWDGTHRLEDGSVIIVHDGQAVPTESMIESWEAASRFDPSLRERYCEQLVRKVCGFRDECARDPVCLTARRMRGEQRAVERQAQLGAPPQTTGGEACREALDSADFPACESGAAPSTCKRLVDRVCGAQGECNEAKACGPARQLLQLESEERLESADPDARTPTGDECAKAMTNAFFEACIPTRRSDSNGPR